MADDLFSKISTLLEDPEMSKKLGEVASSVMGSDGGVSTQSGDPVDAEVMAKLGGVMSGLDLKNNREAALLYALEPYLRPSRAQKVHAAIRALRVINVLSGLQNL